MKLGNRCDGERRAMVRGFGGGFFWLAIRKARTEFKSGAESKTTCDFEDKISWD